MTALAVELPTKDALRYSLEALRAHIMTLMFRRSGGEGDAREFALPETSILLHTPDAVKDLPLPGIGVIYGFGMTEPYGLGPAEPLDELTIQYRTSGALAADEYLINKGNYSNLLQLEVWGSNQFELMAIVAGIEAMLSSDERSSSLNLPMPNYYNLVATFGLGSQGTQYVQDPATSNGRRRALISVQLDVCDLLKVVDQPVNPDMDADDLASAEMKLEVDDVEEDLIVTFEVEVEEEP